MIEISTQLQTDRLTAVVAFLAMGTSNARIEIYEGTRPVLGEEPTGERLASIVLVEPVGDIKDGVLTLTPTEEAIIETSGEATWARVLNGDGELAWDCDVSDLAGLGELRLPSTTLFAGGFTRLVSGVLA